MEKAIILLGIGVVILASGLAMPSQQTQSATSCVDSNYDAADGCVETTYTVPNYGKTLTTVLGLVMVLGGVGAIYSQSNSGGSTTITNSSITDTSDTSEEPASVDTDVSMLHEQVQSENDDKK